VPARDVVLETCSCSSGAVLVASRDWRRPCWRHAALHLWAGFADGLAGLPLPALALALWGPAGSASRLSPAHPPICLAHGL